MARECGLRRRRPRPASRPLATEIPLEPVDLPPVSDQVEHLSQTRQIASALRALTPEHRMVVIEPYYPRGGPAALGIPPGTVKSRHFHALGALRDALAERGLRRR